MAAPLQRQTSAGAWSRSQALSTSRVLAHYEYAPSVQLRLAHTVHQPQSLLDQSVLDGSSVAKANTCRCVVTTSTLHVPSARCKDEHAPSVRLRLAHHAPATSLLDQPQSLESGARVANRVAKSALTRGNTTHFRPPDAVHDRRRRAWRERHR